MVDDDDDVVFNPDLFLPNPDDFPAQTITVGTHVPIQLSLFGSAANSTDFDMTGIIVWPVSKLLAWYIIEHAHLFRDKNVLEIGCGCALAGLAAVSMGSKSVILTDGEPLVLDTVGRTVEAFYAGMQVQLAQLLWGSDGNVADFFGRGCCDVVIGADVFHPSFGEPVEVFELVEQLAKDLDCFKFIVGYVDRNNKDAVFGAAKTMGWSYEHTPNEGFMGLAEPLSSRPLFIYTFEKKKIV